MKRALAVSVVAAVVGTSAAGAASAATPAKSAAAALQVQEATFAVNGTAVPFRVVRSNGETLVSIRDLGTAVGAQISVHNGVTTVELNGHKVEVKLNAKQLVADGTTVALAQAVRSVNGASYIALRPLVAGLGGTVAVYGGQINVSTVKLLEGAENPRFAGASSLIVSVTGDDGRTDYLVDAKSGKYEQLLNSTNASDLVVAPNGSKAAYTDSDGAVYVIDLAAKTSSKVSSDNNIKPELVWSADSSSIFFLQGDKGSVIAKLDPASGTITKLLEDKVDYKANLSVSPDGTKFIYTVTTLGKVTSDATNVDEDNVSIDFSANQQQIFSFDSTVAEGKPVQLTTSTDDKLFVASEDGVKAYYVSVPSEDQPAKALVVGQDQKTSTVYGDSDVIETVLAGGKLYVLASLNDAANGIYEIDPASGSKKQLYTVPAEVTAIAASGSQVAIVKNDQLFVNDSGVWKPITK